jgi:indolepyruvate ferredoxin oxidoreductase alpha subunit
MPNASQLVSGAQALARGAIEAGVSLVTGYPGGPATAVVNAILARTAHDEVRVEWNSNEKVAIEMAFGASVGGMRSLLCVKSVGLNVALDPLMVYNLSGCNAGFVLLVGDDPGGWGSQNEQDSRALALAAELPLIEPTSVSDARAAMRDAFQLSEEMGLPVLVRVTRALVLAEGAIQAPEALAGWGPPPPFQREFMRWVVLPVNVVPYHLRLHQRLDAVRARFEGSPLNGVVGDGAYGVIAAGFAYQKLMDLLGGAVPPELRILRLGTFHPLPAEQVTAFLRSVRSALVLEETSPLVERAVRAVAQERGLSLSIYGRDTDHLSRGGELFAPHIAAALNRFLPRLDLSAEGKWERPMPSREPLCDGCPYVPAFDALVEAIDRLGGRDAFIVVGDPGCMVRAQSPPYKLLDVKASLGSSLGIAAGIALSQRCPARPERSPGNPAAGTADGPGKRVVALCGDSSFLHSGFSGLVDAARTGIQMLVLILDNGTTALSGGQPHPASRVDARGQPRPAVDLAALARDAGADVVRVVDLAPVEDVRAAIEMGMDRGGVAVVIARGRCPRWPMRG